MTLLIFCAGLLVGCYGPPLLAKLFTLGEPPHHHVCDAGPPLLRWDEILKAELGEMPPIPKPRKGRHQWPEAEQSLAVHDAKDA